MAEQIRNEDELREAMAAVAAIENDRLSRVMSGEIMSRQHNAASMSQRVEAFAETCGQDGKTQAEVARILRLPSSTIRTHAHRAILAGKVRKVQPSRNRAAIYFDARGME